MDKNTKDFEAKTNDFVKFVKDIYGEDFIPLHRPIFNGNEKKYLCETIDSTFVSSVGKRVTELEQMVAAYTGAKYAIATVNGTAALHTALILAGVKSGDEVISQALTFVATCNAISYAHAKPVFLDVDRTTMGLSPEAVQEWIDTQTIQKNGFTVNKTTGAIIRACVPMHTFGLPARTTELARICKKYNITLIEDAAESLGSFTNDRHTGLDGALATLSFNGNKVITTGGGGMIITNDEALAKTAKHLTTTAKVPHPTEFVHDRIGYNYRMPNLNAALGCAQMEVLPQMLSIKAEIASQYREYADEKGWEVIKHPNHTKANDWLVAILLDSKTQRQEFLNQTNTAGVMTRPIWRLMNELEMFKDCQTDGLRTSRWLEERIVNVPSSVPDKDISRVFP